MTAAQTDVHAVSDQLATASAALKSAAVRAERVGDWLNIAERVDAGIVLDQLEDMSLSTVRLLTAAQKAHKRFTDNIRQLDRRDRITYELLHTAASAARQFNATLADVVDEHLTLP